MSTLSELLQAVRDGVAKSISVAMPGRVVAYHSDEGTVDVHPLLMETEINPDIEEEVDVSQPIIFKCPVIFPGAGMFRLTFPIAVGDTVLLVFADKSIEEWMFLGKEASSEEERRHHHSDAIAIVGLNDLTKPWTGAERTGLTIGKDGGVQTEYTGTEIHLGLDAVEQFILGTTYRQNETQKHNSMASQFTSLASQLTTHAASFTTQAAASVGVLAPLQPGFTALAAQATAMSSLATALAAAIDQFEANTTQYLSNVVRGL